jgi:hypothetical protein
MAESRDASLVHLLSAPELRVVLDYMNLLSRRAVPSRDLFPACFLSLVFEAAVVEPIV